jgi:hypothetical protein
MGGASRIVRENQKYLARVQRSMDAEKNAREQRRKSREEREQRQEEHRRMREERRDHHIESSCTTYATFWCQTTGVAVPSMIRAIKTGAPPAIPTSVRPPSLKVFDTEQRRSYDMLLADMIKMIMHTDFPFLEPHAGQVQWGNNFLVPHQIYELVAQSWHDAR